MNWLSEYLDCVYSMDGSVTEPGAQVKAAAVAIGYRPLHWCPVCATFRSSEDCQVCRLRRQLEALERDNAEAFSKLPPEEQERRKAKGARPRKDIQMPVLPGLDGLTESERALYEDLKDLLVEAWQVKVLVKEKNRVKQETARIREYLKGGTDGQGR